MKNRLFSLVRESCARVAGLARSVRINRELIGDYVASLPIEKALNPVMDTENHFCDDPEAALVYFLVLDCINFGSGWFNELDLEPGCTNGYFTIASRLKRDFIARGSYPAAFLQQMSAEECCRVFGQNPDNSAALQLMTLFAAALRDFGDLLQRDFSGSCRELVLSSGYSAAELGNRLLKMPFYRDIFPYAGRDVYLLKRLQITASDLHIAFNGTGYGRFDDIRELTIFADNLVPHVLMIDGILQYSDSLAAMINSGQPLASGSEEEIELRACCVHAVELMREELSVRNIGVSSQGLDYLLWNRGLEEKYAGIPSHRTRCVFY